MRTEVADYFAFEALGRDFRAFATFEISEDFFCVADVESGGVSTRDIPCGFNLDGITVNELAEVLDDGIRLVSNDDQDYSQICAALELELTDRTKRGDFAGYFL